MFKKEYKHPEFDWFTDYDVFLVSGGGYDDGNDNELGDWGEIIL